MTIRSKTGKESQTGYSFKNGLKDFQSGFHILILQATAVVTIFVLYMAIQYNMSNSLMLHICFCTIGYGLLMTSAILLFAGDNFFGRSLTRYHKSLVHGVIIGVGSVLATAGISIEINGRGDEWPHFTSTHAITGLVSMILMLTACLGGILASHVQKVRHLIPCIKPVWWKIFHNTIGLLSYSVGMCAFCYGFDTWWFNLVASYEQRVAAITVSAIIATWTVLSPLVTLFGYVKTAFAS